VTLKESILWPLTLPYGAVTHLRARAYRTGLLQQRRLDGVVISVGNLTAGGTGKTPMVLWIAQRLLAERQMVAILTRGYRGRASATGSTSDEVQLLQARLQDHAAFGVGKDRFALGCELVKRGVKWFILDDGFQHLQLARDADIVMIDATDPFGGGHLLPAGRLREPRSAVARADVIVVTRSKHAPAVEAAIRHDSSAPIFYARPQLDSIRHISNGQLGDQVSPRELPAVFAFCGIANPNAFLADLREWGPHVAGHRSFPDHHRYAQGDADEIERGAKGAGASGLICTEKDFYNLRGVHLHLPAFLCSISLQIDREDEFWRTLVTMVESRGVRHI
jgi:tetraacyldisaccharide 4'-kinase